ncbi:MAG: ABC transporter substrate-binding protein [Anaerolineae bacterium]
MTEHRSTYRMSRRDFLKAMGVLAGTAAAGPVLSACVPVAGPPAASKPFKVGVLFPKSGIYAFVGESIGEAMQMYFESVGNEAGGRKIEFTSEDTEIKPDIGLQKARKLVEQDQVDLVAGVVSSGVANAVRDYFHDNKKILIIANAGSNALTRAKRSPYIFRTSFSNWQNEWPLGGWAYENVAHKVFVSAPDYAAGHDMVNAFLNNFLGHGGELIGEPQFTPFPSMGDPAPFISEIKNANPPMVYCFYGGQSAANFIKAYGDFGLSGKIPIVADGATVGEDVLPAQGDAALGVYSGLHWALLLDNPENKAFTKTYKERTNRDANVFAMQGYDTARVIVEALNALGGDTSDTGKLIEAIGAVQFKSPRGEFKFDPETHNVINHVYLRQVQKVEGGLHNVVLQDLGEFPDPGDDSKG